MTRHDPTLIHAPQARQRARGEAQIATKLRPGEGSALEHLRQSGSFRVLFPRAKTDVEAVLLNTAGGITGGDRFHVSVEAGEGSSVSVTTQAAERAYRAVSGEEGQVTNRLKVAHGAQMLWLPQETILFDGCSLSRTLTVDLAGDSRFVMVEPVCFGRVASGEVLENGSFSDSVIVRRDRELIYRDGVRLKGDIGRQLHRPAIANGGLAMASLVMVAPEAEAALDSVRALLGPRGGASLLAADILVARLVAEDGFTLRQSMMPMLSLMTQDKLPKCWRL